MIAELTAVRSGMSSSRVCMKFMTLSLTGSLATPPSCTGDTDEGKFYAGDGSCNLNRVSLCVLLHNMLSA